MKKINKAKYISFVVFLQLLLTLSACTPSPQFELYEGNPLRIAVVGEPPEVKEEQVRFEEISFDQMREEELNSFDAVFIMEDNLFEAADSQYADIYADSSVPFFFIGTDNYAPFIEEELEYDKTSNWTAGTGYAVGVLLSQKDDAIKKWEYGLYNDEKTNEHILDVYSRIFKTIDELN